MVFLMVAAGMLGVGCGGADRGHSGYAGSGGAPGGSGGIATGNGPCAVDRYGDDCQSCLFPAQSACMDGPCKAERDAVYDCAVGSGECRDEEEAYAACAAANCPDVEACYL